MTGQMKYPNKIGEILDARRLSQADLARGMTKERGTEVSTQLVNKLVKGERRLHPKWLPLIVAALGVKNADVLPDLADDQPSREITAPASRPTIGGKPAQIREALKAGDHPSAWPRDVPILGFAKGGDGGFYFDNGEPQGMALRPPQLAGVKNGFAFYVQDTSMEPRYLAGELAYVNPLKPPRPGQHVVVELIDGQAIVKRLDKEAGGKVHLWQYNPPQAVVIPRSKVMRMQRVVAGGDDLP